MLHGDELGCAQALIAITGVRQQVGHDVAFREQRIALRVDDLQLLFHSSSLSENYHIPAGESVIYWSHDQEIQNR